MTGLKRWVGVLGVPLVVGCGGTADGAPAQPVDGDYAFVGVSVIPMDQEGTLDDQTVVVNGDRIVAVGASSEIELRESVQVIDGEGRFLMPGLAEMHAHVPPSQDPPREVLEHIMFLYIANGVTTIRGMLGASYQLDLAREISDGGMLAPTFYVAAPSLNGNSAPDPETADRLVRQYQADGYDLLKIHPGITRTTWDVLAATAVEVGIPMAGHIPSDVGLRHAVETGQDGVDHLDGYLEALAGYDVMASSLTPNLDLPRAQAAVTADAMASLAEESAAADVHVVPTMYLWDNFFLDLDPDSMTSLDEMKYVSELQREGWRSQAINRPTAQPEVAEWIMESRRAMLGALHEAGVNILMGTDSPQMFNVPGFALHREIQTYTEAGLSNWEILETGTTSVARYAGDVLGLDGSFGTVAEGQRADLVLLNANPLDDLGNLSARAGVMVRGTWVDLPTIQAGLDALAAKHSN